MILTGNTILITGGASGIGRGLAEAFHRRGNRVIIAGRGSHGQEEVVAANPGLRAFRVDLTKAGQILEFSQQITTEFPALNVIIHCAGVMMVENLQTGFNSAACEAILNTNLLAPMRLTEALLPTLLHQPQGAILTVTSGLAYVPLAMTPTYCASKAALHSFTQSLRDQLGKSNIQVIELIPPYVATTLMGQHQATDPRAMPLAGYISETMELLQTQPDANEIWLNCLQPLREACEGGREQYEAFLQSFNDGLSKH